MEIDFDKYPDSLVPAIIQDVRTKKVLMLGFMSREAYKITMDTERVTFFSRSKGRLWTKGEETKNYLNLVSIQNDCDQDALLVLVNPQGPVCHKGTDTCWGDKNRTSFGFFNELEEIIEDRWNNKENAESYVASLFRKGINKVAQKVGEEAVELVIEAKDDNRDLFLGEAADLMYHYLVLLAAKEFELKDVIDTLKKRST